MILSLSTTLRIRMEARPEDSGYVLGPLEPPGLAFNGVWRRDRRWLQLQAHRAGDHASPSVCATKADREGANVSA